jgi:hypothetical protein
MINIKSAIDSNASNIHHYKSTKREILNCNANIFVNQKQIKSDLLIKHKLVVLYDIQIPLYNKRDVTDRYSTHSLIREVFHLHIAIICQFRLSGSSMFPGVSTADVSKTIGNLFEHAPRSACQLQ